MKKVVEEALIEIFKAVADAVDGCDQIPDYLSAAYEEAWKIEEVQELYSRLVEENHTQHGCWSCNPEESK